MAMTTDTTSPRTRRALLAAALGGSAAVVAAWLGRPSAATAADGNPVLLGKSNTATAPTDINAPIADNGALRAANAASGGLGVCGQTEGVDGTAVFGYAMGTGRTYGSHFISESAGGVGTHGENGFGGTGVSGISDGVAMTAAAIRPTDTPTPPASPGKVGVYGYAGQDSAARGVYGRSTSGQGVRGQATSGSGVYATATTGYALRTSGRVRVDKASGVATIAATKTSVTLTPGLDVTTSSFVLLTPKADLGTRRLWYTTDATNNRFTIRVSSAATVDHQIGWLLRG
jgi:hypothetical protein